MNTLLALALIAAVVWFWVDGLGARERALAACTRACREVGVQLLDQTVAVSRLGFARGGSGALQIQRVYAFEFTMDGVGRRSGHVLLTGRFVEYVHLDMPEDTGTIVPEPDPGRGQFLG